jgi:hypothetical protein
MGIGDAYDLDWKLAATMRYGGPGLLRLQDSLCVRQYGMYWGTKFRVGVRVSKYVI